MADRAGFDPNYIPTLLGVSNDGLNTPVVLWADPTTHRLLTSTQASSLPAAFGYGQVTISVTNTAVALPSNSLANGVIVQALAANVNNVVVGDNSVTTANGFQLQPGQATSIAVSNTNTIYINGTSGDGVCFIGS